MLSKLPAEEKFNLNIQIRKTSISITANIAEGYGRYHFKEGIQFYRISRASLYELKDHLISCVDLNYINDEEFVIALNLIESAKTTLNGFIKFVGNKIKSEKTSK
jgi:four helix bundle protein